MQGIDPLQAQARAAGASVVCFVLGLGAGSLAVAGAPRPLSGDGGVGLPIAIIAGVIAAASFVVSTVVHRRGETRAMPRWQTAISHLSAIALTIAYAGVTALGVLLATEVLSVGLQELKLPMIGGAVLAAVASALGGHFAFRAGVGLKTTDLAALLSSYLVIGTLFAMLTASDPLWWQLNFSQLGSGGGAWAFNGTVIGAGLLIATVGSYIGRDLHRMRGDADLGRIAWVVVLWAATGIALAAIGLFPLSEVPTLHNVAAFATLALFVAASVLTANAIPGAPRALQITTIALVVLVVIATALAFIWRLYSTTVLEAVIVGLGMLWMTTLVRTLAIFTPDASRPSMRRTLLRA